MCDGAVGSQDGNDRAERGTKESDAGDARAKQEDAWLADLPPQVRKAYETKDWDAIPRRWRRLVRAWTMKLAREIEQQR